MPDKLMGPQPNGVIVGLIWLLIIVLLILAAG
jgi:hypothetical protein